MKLTPLAATRTSASPALGSGVGISRYFRFSGPPIGSATKAFIRCDCTLRHCRGAPRLQGPKQPACMHSRRISQQYGKRHGESDDVRQNTKWSGAMQPHPMPEHGFRTAPVMNVQPVEVYVLVDNQNL